MKRYALIFAMILMMPSASYARSCGGGGIGKFLSAVGHACRIANCDDMVDIVHDICDGMGEVEAAAESFERLGRISGNLKDPEFKRDYITDYNNRLHRITGNVQSMGKAINTKMVAALSTYKELNAYVKSAKPTTQAQANQMQSRINSLQSRLNSQLGSAMAEASNTEERINAHRAQLCERFDGNSCTRDPR